HFFGAAAEAMRRILVERARARGRLKGGGGRRRLDLDQLDLATEDGAGDVLAVDEAVTKLAGEDGSAAEVVRLRFFAGLDVPEIAAVLGVAPRTVKREWVFARAWLLKELGEDA
ncbi:MAG: ECF-type sigma factor, partial [Planctomycetes bacterium]|nr:ECF-type sigma factor [Planctomycetota bacterium]